MARGNKNGKLNLLESLVLVGIIAVILVFAYLFWDLDKFYAFIGRDFKFTMICMIFMILGPVIVLIFFDRIVSDITSIITAWESTYITVVFAYHLLNSIRGGSLGAILAVCLLFIAELLWVLNLIGLDTSLTWLNFAELGAGVYLVVWTLKVPMGEDPGQIPVSCHIAVLIPVYVSILAATVVTIREMCKSAKKTKYI